VTPPPRALRSEFLFRLKPLIGPPDEVAVPGGLTRRISPCIGGTVEGPRLNGEVLAFGGDWLQVEADLSARLDVRLTIRASDGALVYLTYTGLRHGPREVLAAIGRGEEVDPESYFMRVFCRFEAPAGAHEWLNRCMAVGIGSRSATGPTYDVHAIL
jgi:hypothetical protein